MDQEYDLWKYVSYSKYGNTTPRRKETPLDMEGKKVTTKKLYEFPYRDSRVYGHKLAVDSQGNWVMEIKGTGEVTAVTKTDITEVMPYTIGVQFETGKTTYHYLAENGKHKVGDVYVVDAPSGRAIVNVVSLDTKNAMATKDFTYVAKLLTA